MVYDIVMPNSLKLLSHTWLIEMKTKPQVLMDVDGCCVKWQSGLPYYLAENALCAKAALECNMTEEFMGPEQIFGCDKAIANMYMSDYNRSSFIKYLAPYTDALVMINEMKEHWDFIAVTALGTDKETVKNRMFNLNSLFPNAFKDIFVCEFGESKIDMLERVKAKYSDIIMFVDDLGTNVESAALVLPEVPRYHVLRGPAERPKAHCERYEVKDLIEVKNHYQAIAKSK